MTMVGMDKFIHDRIRQALNRISNIREMDGRLVVDVPVMYPSGATATIEINCNGDSYWVSDMGLGRLETELVAAEDYYARVAGKVAEAFGVKFDGNAIFAMWTPSPRLEAAIIAVSNASNKACSEAIRHAEEAKGRRQNERIFQRIQDIFGRKSVARSADIRGRHAEWEAHNVVIFPDRRKAIFEPMTSHANSVSSKFLMFTDIKAAEQTISLNAVVRNFENLDEKAQMIGDVANIVSIDSSDDDYRALADAA